MGLVLKAFSQETVLEGKKNICQSWKLTRKRIRMFSNIQDQTVQSTKHNHIMTYKR